MTVPVNDRRIQYVATAAQTIFPYDFEIAANTEIKVLQTVKLTGITNTLVLTTDYTVSNVGVPGGGNITLITGAAVDDVITVTGATPLSRTTDFSQAGDFFTSDLNDQLDNQLRILQENETKTNRSVLLADEDTSVNLTLPIASTRASKFLAFDANGDAIAAAGTTGVAVSAFMETLLDDPDAESGRATLDAQENVVSTRGDIVRGSSSGEAERLALGSNEQILKSDGLDMVWGSYRDADDTNKGIVEIATQAEQETGSSTSLAVTPGRQKFHPSAAKAWVRFNGTGVLSVIGSYNVSAVVDNGTGDYTVNFDTDFSSNQYAVAAAGSTFAHTIQTYNVGSVNIRTFSSSAVATDASNVCLTIFGDQ